jgi:hypothetical protein
MPRVLTRPANRVHVLARRPLRSSPDLSCRTTRPSLLDRRFAGDAWIVGAGPGLLTLCLGAYPLAQIQGSPLDVPALNQLLERARSRRPRRRARA